MPHYILTSLACLLGKGAVVGEGCRVARISHEDANSYRLQSSGNTPVIVLESVDGRRHWYRFPGWRLEHQGSRSGVCREGVVLVLMYCPAEEKVISRVECVEASRRSG
jgi:hypothetical protein